jgi:hypothetical protein
VRNIDIGFWAPLIIIFVSAIIAAVVKRHTKDSCLKRCQGSFVFLKLKTGRWVWGDMSVYPNALEIRYREPEPFAQKYEKLSYILYEQNMESIERILHPSPVDGTPAHDAWMREVRRLQHPSPLRLIQRRLRNIFNMLRDAFTQSIATIFGMAKQRTWLGKVPVADDKVSEVGKTLISIVPNAYEPVLEVYRGQRVVVETLIQDKHFEETGILQEYTSRFILVRDVDTIHEAPPKTTIDALFGQKFDVIYTRTLSTVRHRAR